MTARVTDATTRFSDRVNDYVAARPSYPPELVDLLERDAGLTPTLTLADVGSGTGKLAELFLAREYMVVGVEPNDAMRVQGDTDLARWPRFRSVAGRAEATTLPDASVDAIICGQAFHWFDPPQARVEFVRILRGGPVVLIWNDRVTSGDVFHEGYEALLRTHCPDYLRVASGWANAEVIRAFYHPGTYQTARLANTQALDLPNLLRRLTSSSYVPKSGPAHEAIIAGATALFHAHALDGRVTMRYETKIFHGHLT